MQAKDKSTPLHYFIQSNVIKKEKYIQKIPKKNVKTDFETQILVYALIYKTLKFLNFKLYIYLKVGIKFKK